jgi:hypothetical protein
MADICERLEYHLPTLGTLNVGLFPLASKAYYLLDKNGHIQHLKRMNQLGIIRNVYQGAHHSRWEYIMAQLSLVYELATRVNEEGRKIEQSYGLSSKNTEISDHQDSKASGADIIQCWILLLNLGHLDGTFSTERGVMRTIQGNVQLRHAFLEGICDTDAKTFTRKSS